MSKFVVDATSSQLTADARSSVHPFSYHAPITGEVEASVRDGRFVVDEPITAALQVDLEELRGDEARLDGEMRRRLDIQRFPRAKATVHRVVAGVGDTYQLHGELTLRGQTQPLAGGATVTLDGDQLHAVGTITIDLRDFGIKPPSLLVLKVHPEVQITIDLTAQVEA